MGILREELIEGGMCFIVGRNFSQGGAAVAISKRPAKVKKVERGAALVYDVDRKRDLLVSFRDLAADHDWLHGYKQKREERRAEHLELLPPPAPPPLTYTLADKLAVEEEPQKGASDEERQKALEAIEMLKKKTPEDERRTHSREFKQKVVEEYLAGDGVTMSEVAQRHGINTSLVSVWAKQYEDGSLNRSRGEKLRASRARKKAESAPSSPPPAQQKPPPMAKPPSHPPPPPAGARAISEQEHTQLRRENAKLRAANRLLKERLRMVAPLVKGLFAGVDE
jgi:transposase-like protein